MEQTEEFFVSGLEKYLDAKSAVAMFEQEVQRRVKKVVIKHQSELKALFGEDWSLKDSYDASLMPEYMYLGQQVIFRGSGVLYFSLAFWRDEKGDLGLSPSIVFWRERVALLKPLWEAVRCIRSQDPNLGIRNDRFWITGSQPANDWKSCENALDAVISEWTKLWQELGGLSRYLAAQGPTT